jgi:hypothetical protein
MAAKPKIVSTTAEKMMIVFGMIASFHSPQSP